MKKNLTALIALLLACGQLSAGAAVIDGVSETDNGDEATKTIVISGQVPVDEQRTSGREVTVRIYQKGVTDDVMKLEHFEQTTAQADGSYSITYKKMSDSGDYKIEVNYAAAEGEAEYITHNYLSPELFTQFFSELDVIYQNKDNAEFDAEQVFCDKLVEYSQQNVIRIEKLDEMLKNNEDTTAVFTYMLKYDHEESTDKLVKLFNEGYVLNKVNTASAQELWEALTDEFNAPFIGLNKEIVKTYGTLDADKILNVMASTPFEKIGDISKKFTDTVLVEALSGKIWQSMLEILRNNNTAIGIDFTEYEKLDEDEEQENAMTEFAGRISDVKGAESAKSIFDEAVKNAKGDGDGGSSSSDNGNYDRVTVGGKDTKPSYSININPVNVVTNVQNKKEEYFTDLDGYDWAREAIEGLAAQGYVNGDGNGKFRPGDKVTRAEFLKMVLEATRMKDAPTTDKTFTDVSISAWYNRYVMQGVGAGIINGVSNDKFAPDATIKRADAAVISIRILKYFGQEFTQKNIVYSDVREDYAFEAIYQAAEAGVMNGVGDNLFEPDRGLTRAEAAKIVYNINECKGDYVG